MPRAQVYIDRNNYERIRKIVDEKKADGADLSQANISAICGMLLDIGLRVYEFQQKKAQDETAGMDDTGQFDQDAFNKTLLECVVRNMYASTILLQMTGELEEVKGMESFNYKNVKGLLNDKTNEKIMEVFKQS